MPRVIRGIGPKHRPQHPALVARLAQELRSDRVTGQPWIEEEHFPRTGAVKATVVWDDWDRLSLEDRSEIILDADRQAEGADYAGRIALAIGLTVPEAVESGVLPFQVQPLLRAGDPVTLDQCRRAMLEAGASRLLDPDRPQLRFATEQAAQACVDHLIQILPGSDAVWSISRELVSHAD